jgi:hypothetical protein
VRRRSLHSAPRNLANPADRTSHNVRQDTAHTAAEEQRGQMFGKKAKASFLVRNVVVWLLFFHLTCLASAELPACEHPKFPPKIITQEELAPILEQHTNWFKAVSNVNGANREPAGYDILKAIVDNRVVGRANLCNYDLHGLKLDSAELSGADLRGANLTVHP